MQRQLIEDEAGKKSIYPLMFFNKKGNLLWQKNVDVPSGRLLRFYILLISPHGNRVAYSNDEHIYIVDKSGDLLWKKELEFPNLSYFSKQEDILVMSKEGKIYSVVDALNGDELWSTNQGYPIYSPDKTVIAIIRSISEKNGEEIVLQIMNIADKETKLLMKRKAVYPLNRMFRFSSDSNYIYYVEKAENTKISIYKLSISTIE